jgi:RNA polymerase sigma factor (sigma-70 family)
LNALEDRETSDRGLLERFVASRDQAAFTALVHRRGPLVEGLARRLLHDAHLAEDVFQAVFLILARKAGSICRRESVAAWLYAVTWRLASRLRRRQARTGPVPEPALPADTPDTEAARRELAVVLDEEIRRLPTPLQSPIVLCYLEELTQDEAAARLGWSKAMLRRRLERGRELLRARLTRRGATLSLGLCAIAFSSTGTAASLSSDKVATVAAASVRFALGQDAGKATTSAVRLADQALRSLVERKIRATLLGLCLTLLVAAGGLAYQAALQPAARLEPPAAVKPLRPPARAVATDPLEEKPSEAVLRLGRAGLAHQENVSCAAFSPDGKTLATGGHDRYVRLWDPETGRERRALRHLGWVRSLVWAPDGKTLFSASDNEGVGPEFAVASGQR